MQDDAGGRGSGSGLLRLAALVACAGLGVGAGALPEGAQGVAFLALSGVLACAAWALIVLALPRARSWRGELLTCTPPALVGGALSAFAEEGLRDQVEAVRALTEHLQVAPSLAAFLSGAALVGMLTFLARAAFTPRAPGDAKPED